jgi:hypothetical protein
MNSILLKDKLKGRNLKSEKLFHLWIGRWGGEGGGIKKFGERVFLVTISVLLVPRLTRNAGLLLEKCAAYILRVRLEQRCSHQRNIKWVIYGTILLYSVFQVNKACSSILVKS